MALTFDVTLLNKESGVVIKVCKVIDFVCGYEDGRLYRLYICENGNEYTFYVDTWAEAAVSSARGTHE